MRGGATTGAHRQQVRERIDVAGHGRTRRAGSIGLRLLFPVVAASIGLVAGGAVLIAGSTGAAADAYRARVLADSTAAAVRLVDQIEQEITETNALRERGGQPGEHVLTEQRTRTDLAMSAYLAASRAALAEAPAIARPVGHVTGLLEPFAKARAGALGPGVAMSGFGDAFEQITHHLLDLAAAVAEQVKDQSLGNLARSAAAVSELKHLAAEQRDLLRAAFVRRELTRTQLVTLAQLHGDELAKRSEFTHIASDATRQRFTQLVAGPDVDRANALRDAVLRTGDATSLAADADAWYAVQSGAMQLLRTMERELTTALARTAERAQASARIRAVLTGILVATVVAGTLTAGTALAVRTTRRLRRLRQAALTVARGELPSAVAQVARAADQQTVHDAMSASHRRVGGLLDAGRDEVGEVSAAVGVVHQQALRLAAEQALLRLEVSALFVALSRRGQTIVQRQLQLIDEFEQLERDPQTLARLVTLNHLAARMRRNEENLLVLSGGEPGRRFDAPVLLADIVRAAAAEIEGYARVDPPGSEDVWVAAHAAGDVIHLLAELLDNAVAFSPPYTRVHVLAQRGGDGVGVSVVDSGIGMSDAQLEEGNRRLARPTGLTSTLVGTMGLLVVARLAARRGLRVMLRRGATGGTTADVWLPETVLTAAPLRLTTRAAVLTAPAAWPVPVAQQLPAALPATATATATATTATATTATATATAAVTAATAAATATAAPAATTATTAVAAAALVAAPPPTLTAAGLPARRPIDVGLSTPENADHSRVDRPTSTAAEAATAASDDLFLDPETVRARLSSLASGIAAARHHTEAPPGTPQE